MALLVSHSLRWLSILLLLAAATQHSKAEVASPYQLKAAFIYNFLKFIDWPPQSFSNTDAPFVIGILGKDPFGSTLDNALIGKNVRGRPILVRRLENEASALQCQVLFVSSSERKRFKQILGKTAGRPILTIGEAEEFGLSGGIINFVVEENKIRFEINIDAMKQSGLKADAQLLNLAKIVHTR